MKKLIKEWDLKGDLNLKDHWGFKGGIRGYHRKCYNIVSWNNGVPELEEDKEYEEKIEFDTNGFVTYRKREDEEYRKEYELKKHEIFHNYELNITQNNISSNEDTDKKEKEQLIFYKDDNRYTLYTYDEKGIELWGDEYTHNIKGNLISKKQLPDNVLYTRSSEELKTYEYDNEDRLIGTKLYWGKELIDKTTYVCCFIY